MTIITTEQAQKLLDEATPGPWRSDDAAVRLDDKSLIALVYGNGRGSFMSNNRLIAAVPDLARQLLATLDALADAQARGMEMALKTYRTGAGVDNGNYPLWAYDADYETAVRKKAEVHRKAASDRATRKGI